MLASSLAGCFCDGAAPLCTFPPNAETAVFVGTVVQRLNSPSRARFAVSEHFLGPVGRQFDILEGGGDADCAVRFSVGEAYLVVADHEEHGWVPRACEIRRAAEMTRDLAVLRGQRSIGFAKSLVYGEVLLARSRPAAAAPRPGIEIQLVGPRTRRTTVTDADGRFSFFDLPSDVFTVRAKLPGGTVSQEQLDQRRRRCGYATFLQ